MKQVLLRKGKAVLEEVPVPALRRGALLVRVSHSAVSTGTEKAMMAVTGKPLYRRVLEKPELLRQALQMAASRGLSRTAGTVRGKLGAGLPAGYSAAGVIMEVGEGVTDLLPGDRVACAGAGRANHAEVICVPRNLVVPLPANVGTAGASTVTLGAIAMQGVRRASPTLGERFLVIGLGIIGQLAAQLLKANGVRVIGADPDQTRTALALSLGMDRAVRPDEEDLVEAVWKMSGGRGVDGVIITAASPSHQLVSRAFRSCRRKGRVVLVGDVGLNLNRHEIYEKELDFLVSTSYGPGRYDPLYEEQGVDYPYGYVRWTENRNMEEYIRLIGAGLIRVKPLVNAVLPFAEAPAAFERLSDPAERPLLFLLQYPEEKPDFREPFAARINLSRTAAPSQAAGIAVVGAGRFAREAHLPNIKRLSRHLALKAVVSPNGQQAMEAARRFGAAYAASRVEEVLEDPDVEGILIATRHHLHASLALQALQAGKHVLVEKPLALNRGELESLKEFYAGGVSGKPVLLTGFNRRFSPYLARIRSLLESRTGPVMINYRVNAGFLPEEHWAHGPEGGGRNLGEACHFYDLFIFLAGAAVTGVSALGVAPRETRHRVNENFVATAAFADGSLAVLTYTAMGHEEIPKERLELFYDGKALLMDDYRALQVKGITGLNLSTREQEKGHLEELQAWASSMESGAWPITLPEQIAATELSFRVEEALFR